MRKLATLALSVIGYVMGQNVGTQKSEQHLPMAFTQCYGPGNCQTSQGGVTLDSNWRWTHNTNGYQNCYTGNTWDSNLCPDEKTCTRNCAIDGVDNNDWRSPYGVTTVNGGIQLNFVT